MHNWWPTAVSLWWGGGNRDEVVGEGGELSSFCKTGITMFVFVVNILKFE